jgi:DNA-binding CsgD family transcriptional regulator
MMELPASRFLHRPPDLLSPLQWQRIMDRLALSPREAQLVQQACYDETVEGLAVRLGLSRHTVHTYRERIYRKLGVNSPAQVLSIVFATHLVLFESPRILSVADSRPTCDLAGSE